MIAFEVAINGATVATAGVGDLGVLSTIVTWLRRRADESEELTLDLGGMVSTSEGQTNLRWLSQPLSVGDVISIRITQNDKIDEPAQRTTVSVDETASLEKEHYNRLKDKHEGQGRPNQAL